MSISRDILICLSKVGESEFDGSELIRNYILGLNWRLHELPELIIYSISQEMTIVRS